MKSFKVLDGKVLVDGVLYGESPISDVKIMGKSGTIQSINIGGKGQYFPISGVFNDGTPIVDEPIVKVSNKIKKTELVETSSTPMSADGKPLKKKGGKFTLNPNR